ncbi:hypothetical protein KW805_00750 [Candidatus Pacearchaeota archaeon]|nr:hypothetical protein [Candidatus Pacearchaeota archaeon]
MELDLTLLMWIVAGVVVLLCLVLILIQRRMSPPDQPLVDKSMIFRKEIEAIQASQKPQEMINLFNKLVQEYLKETYNVQTNDYAELSHILYNRENHSLSDFCKKMIRALYSGEELQREQVEALMQEFLAIINGNEKPAQSTVVQKQPVAQDAKKTPETKEPPGHGPIESIDMLERIESKIPSKLPVNAAHHLI